MTLNVAFVIELYMINISANDIFPRHSERNTRAKEANEKREQINWLSIGRREHRFFPLHHRADIIMEAIKRTICQQHVCRP